MHLWRRGLHKPHGIFAGAQQSESIAGLGAVGIANLHLQPMRTQKIPWIAHAGREDRRQRSMLTSVGVTPTSTPDTVGSRPSTASTVSSIPFSNSLS